MKILVLQLARLGDIYQTWPVIRALKRVHASGAEIDLLTRERFAAAATGLKEVNQVYRLESRKLLASVFCDQPKVQEASDALDKFVSNLQKNAYDRIINLSFSSFSSYLTEALCSSHTKVTGYSRFSDGFMNIADEVSSYFFAQVGIGLSNRVHVTDLFAQTAEVELIDQDFCHFEKRPPKNQIVIHIGASAEHKRVSSAKWKDLIKSLQPKYLGKIFLIGSAEESAIGTEISAGFDPEKILNLVGKTSLEYSMNLISDSELLIGADSAPIHMAALTGTPVLNLSFESVNFWETGPKSEKSQILRIHSEAELTENLFLTCVESILYDEKAAPNVVHIKSPTAPVELQEDDFGWRLNVAIYMGGDLPYVSDFVVKQAFLRLYEANQLALEQVSFLIKDPKNKIALSSFEQCDLIFSTIEKLSPEIGVLVRWIRTEKLRIPPGNYSEIMLRFENVHLALDRLLKTYPLENWYQLKNGVLNDKDILDEA